MLEIKEKWIVQIQEKLSKKFDNNVKMIFKAKDGLGGNSIHLIKIIFWCVMSFLKLQLVVSFLNF